MFRHRYIVLAVVFALLGTILTSHYIKKLEQKALGQGPREQVVVTRVAIAEGTELKNNMVERRMWPADLVPKGAAKDMESVLGRLAGVALEPGEVVLASRLLEGDKQGIAWQLAAGERAVTIDVSNVEGMELEFTPGNRVDVLGVLTDYRSGVDRHAGSRKCQDTGYFQWGQSIWKCSQTDSGVGSLNESGKKTCLV